MRLVLTRRGRAPRQGPHKRPLGDLSFPWRRKFKGGSSSVQKIAPFKGNFDHTDEADEPEDDDDEGRAQNLGQRKIVRKRLGSKLNSYEWSH